MPGRNRPGRLFGIELGPCFLVLRDLVTYAGSVFSETLNRFRFRRFWGEGILSNSAYFVMDSYEDVKLRNDFRRVDVKPSSLQPLEVFPDSAILPGTFFPQAVAMLTELFSQNTGQLMHVATGAEVEGAINATLICYGNSDSNAKTFDVEASSDKALCQFVFDVTGQPAFQLGEQLYTIERRDGITYDRAILLRLTNPQYPNHCYVVCAGLSEWGSLAAVYYLTKKWKVLHDRFDQARSRRDFCVLLDVQSGQFESAREVASVVRLAPIL